MWHSQFQEDFWIWQHREQLGLPEKGTFVEVGAYDGVSGSNTLAFEEMGWTGLCIEPYPKNALLCKKNRVSATMACAIADVEGVKALPLHINLADLGTNGLRRKPTGHIYYVPAVSLSLAAEFFQISYVDILSIDTEGSEVDVWISRGRLHPRIVIAEFWSQPEPPNLPALEAAIIPCGYRLAHQTEANAIFVKE